MSQSPSTPGSPRAPGTNNHKSPITSHVLYPMKLHWPLSLSTERTHSSVKPRIQRKLLKRHFQTAFLAFSAVPAMAALFVYLFSNFALGQEKPGGTLQKIKDGGVIVIGTRESSIPFSYYDQNNQVVGYAQDLANLVVDAVKQKLNLPNLREKLVPVTSQTRIPLVQSGSVDLEAGSTTNNLEREQQVSFSDTFFIISTRLLVKKDSGIKDFPDLKGKNVVVTAGTTSERLIHQLNDKDQMGMQIIAAKDHGESFLILQSGRAAAFMLDDALLAGERAKARNPSDWVIVGTPQSKEAYGMMLKKDDTEFKAVVDAALADAEKNGTAETLYKKWFMSPIPPKGLNLDLPLSDDMKQLFQNPNDKAFQ
jgi:glutamate/aspartate transport system substrate-binding protein